MNYSIICKILSMVLWTMALAFSMCAGVSAIYSSSSIMENEAMQSWICLIAFAILSAFAFYLPSRNAPKKLFKKEAMCVVGLGWIMASLIGALPYILILDCGFASAFFESTSGLTTTGSSAFGSFEDFPHSLMFWRCLSHWIGGMGVLVFFVALLSFLGTSGRILYASETSVSSGGGIETERIQSGAFKILFLYLIISTLCLATFKLCGMGWFDGICHTFSVVATGGFSVYEESFAHYDSNIIYWATIVFMFIGGTSFILMLYLLSGNIRKLWQNTEFWVYISLIIGVSLIITPFLADSTISYANWWDSFTQSTFQTVSIITTTGFASCDYGLWKPASILILFLLTLIGGCAGSTSGGLKISRVVIGIKIIWNAIEKSFRPRVVRNISINGKVLDNDDIFSVMSYILLYFFVIALGIIILAIIEHDMSFVGTLTAVCSTISNTGPAFAEVGPTQNFGFVNACTKITLAVMMIAGRLEFYALLVLFMPSLWKKFQ